VGVGRLATLPVHRTEDEVFHLLEGELVLMVDGATRRVGAGETHIAPKGVPHTYRVVSDRARWLVTTTNGDFERFVRAASRPAARAELPESAGRRAPSSRQRSPSSPAGTAST
jgi:mannose-6-phosphate isomerase-like protein (cupin superfamily)